MPRGYWLPIIAACGLALAATANAQPIRDNSGAQAGTQQSQPEVTANQPPVPPQTIQSAVESVARALETANNKEPSAEETQRAKDDLKAQQDMADWAKRMFFIGSIEALITASGVFLVYRTLVHTRRAADAAHDAVTEAKKTTEAAKESAESFRFSERAWISLKTFGVGQVVNPVNDKPTVVGYAPGFIWVNAGNTPALNITNWTMSQVIGPDEEFKRFEKTDKGIRAFTLGPTMEFQCGGPTMGLLLEDIDAVVNHRKKLFVWSRCEYSDIFQPQITRHSELCIEVSILLLPELVRNPEIKGIPIGTAPTGDQNGAS